MLSRAQGEQINASFAYIIMRIYRDDFYTKELSKEPDVAEVIIAKQRNGLTVKVKLAFLKPITKFESLASGGGVIKLLDKHSKRT